MSEDLRNAKRNMIIFFTVLLAGGVAAVIFAFGGIGGKLQSETLPTCSDDRTIALIRDIIKKKDTTNALGDAKLINLSSITTLNQSGSGNNYSCSAILKINNEDLPIQYSVMIADDKKSFFVKINQ